MRFITVSELRRRSADIWRHLAEESEIVITSNGKPMAILSAVSSAGLDESLFTLRRTRALRAVEDMQTRSVAAGKHRMSQHAIQTEIDSVRKRRAK